MIIELLDPRFRYDVNGLTEEELLILSSEVYPEDPMFWKKHIFIPQFKGRLLELRVNEDGSISYYYTQRDHSAKHILPLHLVIKRFNRVRSIYLHNNHKFIVL